jgi:hypothetical protein
MGMLDDIFDSGYSEQSIEGVDYIMSPDGYRILTEYYLMRRGFCCSNGCRNCPYSPKAVKGNRLLQPDIEKKYPK